MKLEQFATSLKAKVAAIGENQQWFVNTKFGSSIMDSVHVWVATTPKESWPSNIFHNADYVILMITEKGQRYETPDGVGPYKLEVSSINKMPRLIGKTGSLEQIEAYLVKYFTNVAKSLSLVEALLEGRSPRPLEDLKKSLAKFPGVGELTVDDALNSVHAEISTGSNSNTFTFKLTTSGIDLIVAGYKSDLIVGEFDSVEEAVKVAISVSGDDNWFIDNDPDYR